MFGPSASNNIHNVVGQVDNAFIFIVAVSFIFLTLITVLMIYFVIRYRKSKNPVPSDIRGNNLLEVVWTVIPTGLAMIMFYLGWQSYLGLRNVPSDAIEISVTAEMFNWVFEYPENGKESENLLVVPQGKPIKLNLTSIDVLHALYIPSFRVKVDAVPKMQTYVWFMADRLGEYDILCAEYCGTNHAGMLAKLKIVPPADYEKWLTKESDDEESEDQETTE